MPNENSPKVTIDHDGVIHVDNNSNTKQSNPGPTKKATAGKSANKPASSKPFANTSTKTSDDTPVDSASTPDDANSGCGCGCLFAAFIFIALASFFTLGSGMPLPLSIIAAGFLAFVVYCVFGGSD